MMSYGVIVFTFYNASQGNVLNWLMFPVRWYLQRSISTFHLCTHSFLIHINSLSQGLKICCKMFADYTSLFSDDSSPDLWYSILIMVGICNWQQNWTHEMIFSVEKIKSYYARVHLITTLLVLLLFVNIIVLSVKN